MNRLALYKSLFILALLAGIGRSQSPTPTPSPSQSLPGNSFSENATYLPRLFDYGRIPKPIPLGDKTSLPESTLTLPLLVFDANDSVVANIQKNKIKVFLGEYEQSLVSVEHGQAKVILVFDVSPSTEGRIAQMRGLASRILEKLKPDDEVMVAQFSSNLKVLCDFTDDRKSIIKAIGKTYDDDGTSIYSAVSEIFGKKVPLANGPTTIILFSDGVDTTSRRSTFMGSLVDAERGTANVFPVYFDTFDEQVKASKKSGFTPTVTQEERQIGLNYLNDLIKLSGGRGVSFDPSSSDTDSISSKLANWIDAQYFVTIKLSLSEGLAGRLPLRFRINQPGLTVIAKGSLISTK